MDRQHYISYIREEVNHEISRLKTLLRNSHIAEEERGVVRAMLEFYEDARMVEEMSSPESLEGFVLHRTRGTLRSAASCKKARAA